MIRLIIPVSIAARMTAALNKAGKREIGGIMMGEHVGENTFRLLDVSVQTKGGTFAFFVRRAEAFVQQLTRFFSVTQREYTRYNYIGEWHSHHSFALHPSPTDIVAIEQILEDPDVGANFVSLLLVRLSEIGELQCQVYLNAADLPFRRGRVELESF